MLDLIIGGGILTAIYLLFIRGYFFRFVLWIFGFVGLSDFLSTHIHALTHSPLTILDHPVNWAIVISFFITLAAIITTKIKDKS